MLRKGRQPITLAFIKGEIWNSQQTSVSNRKQSLHTLIHTMAPKVAEKAVKAPASKAPAAKKVVKKATSGASKKKTKAVESYKIYIYKVLKQV